MFQDLPEGQTHSMNDGCGEKAHNNTTIKSILEELSYEFTKDPDLAGAHGYCNPVMATNIAEWWTNNLTQKLTELRNSVIEECIGVVPEREEFISWSNEDRSLAKRIEQNNTLSLPIIEKNESYRVDGFNDCRSQTIDNLNNLKV